MNDRHITVPVATPYEVVIGEGLLTRLDQYLKDLIHPCTVAIVTDTTVSTLYLQRVTERCEAAGLTPFSYVFAAGEGAKHFGTLSHMLEFFAVSGLTRSDLVLALGGGVCGDMAGFAAAIYLRGLPYIQCPTTLLAAVDASVGGKTAIDLEAGKNLAGAFHQPLAVWYDTATYTTLPDDHRTNGLAEVVKYAMIADAALFDTLLQTPNDLDLTALVARCVTIKADIVAEDEHEQGMRKLLNLGHTIGHAIEHCSHFGVLHGHAVAIGMVMITRMGESLGLTTPGTCDRLIALCQALHLPTTTDITAERLAMAAQVDKKRSGDRITLVIPERIGACRLHTVEVNTLIDLIRLGQEETA